MIGRGVEEEEEEEEEEEGREYQSCRWFGWRPISGCRSLSPTL